MVDSELRRALGAWEAEEHPTEESWERFALDELEAPARERLLDHALACARCARTLRALGELERLAPELLGAKALPASPVRRSIGRGFAPSVRVWALAATLLAAVGVAYWIRGATPVAPQYRAPSRPDRPRLAAVSPVPGAATIELRFDGLEGRPHHARVFTADGVPVWSSEPTLERRVELPVSALPAPGSYLWQVIALGEADAAASSEVGRFEWGP